MKKKIIRITTVPMSLNKLLEGQLSFTNQYYEVIAVSSNDKQLREVGLKEGISTHTIEMTRKITPVKDAVSLFKLYFFLKKQKPAIVHTHTPKAGIIGMLASKLANVPVRLHTVAGLPLLEAQGVKRQVLDFVEKLTYICATRVYPNSFGLKTIIEQEKFTKSSKLEVIGNGSSNGIDVEYFCQDIIKAETITNLRTELKITDKDFVFIFVGRIVGDKGINELVEAFNSLNKQHQDVKLLLVGPTEEELDPIKIETKELISNNENILTTGYKEDVRPYFAISDILTFPSYREGFPNVVMQAGAMGLPSIVSNINGCNEIISQGVNGSIIKVKNANALNIEMESYLTNADKYEETKKNARNIIVKKYQRAVFLNALLNEYKKFE